MTTSMPSGEGTVSDGPEGSALDDQAAPRTGPESVTADRDTAVDVAGESDAVMPPDEATEGDPDTGPLPGSAGPGDREDRPDPEPAGSGRRASDGRTVLDGPALENPEMHRATDDLRASEEKTTAAREIADDLAAATQPGDA